MKRLARPSMECLKELESIKDKDRIDSLQTRLKDFLIEGTKHANDLKAHHKILADAERNSRSDPNNELWLAQLQDKTTRHQQCLDAIDALLSQTVHAIDQHSRSETISIVGSLVQGGYFDATLPQQNNPPNSSLISTTTESSSSTTLTASISTIQKDLDNERKERDDSIQSVRQQFHEYRDFNNNRFTELQKNFDQLKQTFDTRLKYLADHHRKEISSLKAGYQLAQIKYPLEYERTAASETQNHNNNQSIEREPLRPVIPQRDKQHELSQHLNSHQTNLNTHSLTKLIDDTRARLDQLTQLTTTTLAQVQPEIKRVTSSIQLQVIQSTKTVISDGHQDISTLIEDMFTKMKAQVDQLEPIVQKSSEEIRKLDSNQETFQTQINQHLESKLKEVGDQIETMRSESLKKQEADKTMEQMTALKNQIREIEKQAIAWKDNLSKSIDQFQIKINNTKSLVGENKKSISCLVGRVEAIEKSMVELENNQRYSTPPPESNNSAPSQHGFSQTPPSPPTSNRMNRPVVTDFARTSSSTGYYQYNRNPEAGYYQYNRNSETAQQPLQLINKQYPIASNCSQSQNLPIAARFTNAPSLNASAPASSSSSSNNPFPGNGHPHAPKKRKPSGEPSLAVLTHRNSSYNNNNNSIQQQSMTGARRFVGINGEAANHTNQEVYNQHQPSPNQEYQENYYDPHQFHQQNKFADQLVPASNLNANTTTPLPQSTLPLAKRLKNDFDQYPHRPQSTHHENYNKCYPLPNHSTGNYLIHHQNKKRINQQSSKRN